MQYVSHSRVHTKISKVSKKYKENLVFLYWDEQKRKKEKSTKNNKNESSTNREESSDKEQKGS